MRAGYVPWQIERSGPPTSLSSVVAFMSRRLLTFVSSALLCLSQSAYSQETSASKRDVAGVRLAIALTNSALIAGTNTLLKCWLTNDSATGLSLECGGGGPDPGNCYLEIWLKAEGGKEYVLVHGPGTEVLSNSPDVQVR